MESREKWSAFAVTGSLALMILMALLAVVECPACDVMPTNA